MMKSIKEIQTVLRHVFIGVILINANYCYAEEPEQDWQEVLAKGLYEYEKQTDYTNDPEGKRKSDEYIEKYEDIQKRRSNSKK